MNVLSFVQEISYSRNIWPVKCKRYIRYLHTYQSRARGSTVSLFQGRRDRSMTQSGHKQLWYRVHYCCHGEEDWIVNSLHSFPFLPSFITLHLTAWELHLYIPSLHLHGYIQLWLLCVCVHVHTHVLCMHSQGFHKNVVATLSRGRAKIIKLGPLDLCTCTLHLYIPSSRLHGYLLLQLLCVYMYVYMYVYTCTCTLYA